MTHTQLNMTTPNLVDRICNEFLFLSGKAGGNYWSLMFLRPLQLDYRLIWPLLEKRTSYKSHPVCVIANKVIVLLSFISFSVPGPAGVLPGHTERTWGVKCNQVRQVLSDLSRCVWCELAFHNNPLTDEHCWERGSTLTLYDYWLAVRDFCSQLQWLSPIKR